jgi:hypothetical protein
MPAKAFEKHLLEKTIELFPLDLMRGMSFRHSIIIVDECQNCSFQQLHMALSRMGEGSQMILTGDDSPSQRDCDSSGFAEVVSRLASRPHRDVAVVRLGKEDIQRHPLIGWLNDRLTEPTIPDGWEHFLCPGCSATCYYADVDDAVDHCKCWKCDGVSRLWDGDAFSPFISPSRTFSHSRRNHP